MTEWIQVVTTTDDEAEAEIIARHLVDRRLAACVQIEGPIRSYYRWKGKMEMTREWRCLIKTDLGHYQDVLAAVRNLHHYQVPEIVAIPLTEILPEYRSWLEESLEGDES